MSGSRQLIDVLAEWRRCEEASGEAGPVRKDVKRSPERNKSALAHTIEGEIIPRLMLAHRSTMARSGQSSRRVEPADVAELARLILDHDNAVALAYVIALRDEGVSIDALYVDLLAPTARLLGEMWNADLCDFTDVTVGLSRLQGLLHELSPSFDTEPAYDGERRCMLLLPVPGEQHTLGIMLVEESFRRAGWECTTGAPKTPRELIALVKSQPFDAIGLSVSCGVLLESAASAIQSIRKAAVSVSTTVLVGGPVFLDQPELAERVGADGTAQDGHHAVLQLRHLLDRKATSLR